MPRNLKFEISFFPAFRRNKITCSFLSAAPIAKPPRRFWDKNDFLNPQTVWMLTPDRPPTSEALFWLHQGTIERNLHFLNAQVSETIQEYAKKHSISAQDFQIQKIKIRQTVILDKNSREMKNGQEIHQRLPFVVELYVCVLLAHTYFPNQTANCVVFRNFQTN